MAYAGVPSFFGSRLEDGHVPTFWLLLVDSDPAQERKAPR